MLADIPFSDIAEINPPRRKLNFDDGTEVSFVPMSDVSESGRWIIRSSRPLYEVSRGYTYFKEGDVLFAKITPCTENGKGFHAIGIENGLGFASTEFHVLRAKENADPRFIYQWSIYQPLRLRAAAAMAGSAGQQRVPASFFSSFRIPRIAKPEQTKIAEILSTVDRAIEQTEVLIAKQQRIKTGLMQDLLTRGIDEHGNLRSEQTHQFKDSPLGRIPVEWEAKRIGDVFEIQLGKMLSQKATEGRSPFFYLGNKNVQWDRVDTSALQLMDFNERERCKFELKFHDILVCEGGEVGRTAIWRGEVETCYYQKAIHRLRPIDQQFLPGLFPRFMKWCIREGLLSDYTSQTSIAHLTQEKLAAVPIMVPALPEQRKLNAAFDQLDNELDHQSARLSKLHSLKTALMQDLLTGKKRVLSLLEAEGLVS
jgi:type I restriction enzyme S subunit